MRVVSLVPSLSEFVFSVRPEALVGVTRFCIYPPELLETREAIGGTKNPDIAKIAALKPDLVLANKEENRQEDVQALRELGIRVLVTEITTIEQALVELSRVGEAIGAEKATAELRSEIEKIRPKAPGKSRTAVYVIWRKPWMAAGGDTFISSMMEAAGYRNAFAHTNRYPVFELTELKAINPEVILLSSEPFPFKNRHVQEVRRVLTETEILLVDGALFSWYGSRMKIAFERFGLGKFTEIRE